jgi:divalent metal cation (Fe/Co/Zn/Cd) transporter
VEGVVEIEKFRIRKGILSLLMDIHVVVQGDMSIREGHRIGHEVQKCLVGSELQIMEVIVHVEPDDF